MSTIPVFTGRRLVAVILPASETRWQAYMSARQALESQPEFSAQVSCREPLPGQLAHNRGKRRKGPGNSWKAHRLTQWR